MDYKDGIKLTDTETGEELIFNFKTWIEIIKGIIIKYANKTEEEANSLIKERDFLIPKTYMHAVYYSHDIAYHWAMLVVYKEMYWHKGISSKEPEGYDKWEKAYRKTHSLKEESFEFL